MKSGIFKPFVILMLLIAPLATLEAEARKPIRAIAFDAFPIFDPRPVDAVAAELFPNEAKELMKLWRVRQFEYQWLRALGGEYKGFKEVTEDALLFATRQLGLTLTDEARKKLMSPYTSLTAWPDAREAIAKLKKEGYQIVFLSNMSREMLQAGVTASGLEGTFDEIYSTDSRKTYKPSPQAYQIAVDGLRLSREEILFVAFAGWDAAGAKWFGYPTFWVNRSGASPEELGVFPDGTGRNLQDLLNFLDSYSKSAPLAEESRQP